MPPVPKKVSDAIVSVIVGIIQKSIFFVINVPFQLFVANEVKNYDLKMLFPYSDPTCTKSYTIKIISNYNNIYVTTK